jgi:ferrous iron transport protein B
MLLFFLEKKFGKAKLVRLAEYPAQQVPVAARRQVSVALAGNPNSGKTTIFNNLTGARQHVGNYPGVTVEKKSGTCHHNGTRMNIADLPGTYSLTAHSVEEMVARNFIINEKPDVVVVVLDASNLERNLYLATQLMELAAPLVLALNMSDVAHARGVEFDIESLSTLLGAPIVPTVGHKNEGTEALLDAIVAKAAEQQPQTVAVSYGEELESEIARISELIDTNGPTFGRRGPRWLAIKLLENDKDVREKVGSRKVLDAVEESTVRLEKLFGHPPEVIIAEQRYGFISGACMESVRSTVEARHTRSDQIDTVVTNRVLGFPIFFGLMYLVFQLTFTLGGPPMGWIESFFGWAGAALTSLWPVGAESALKSLLVDGIIGGVGGVIVFLPNIMLLFLAIAILEDTGYMARAAFIMDRAMHKIGLHGKSFIPMLIGFGCSVPAIMATRTIENRKDRLTTMLVLPLMSCGARLPIYVLIIPAFFPEAWQAPMLWIIYMVGLLLAVTAAKLLKRTVFKGDSPPFVMEFPPYRMPTLKGMLLHTWERAWLYIKKAGTIILGISIILWAMTTYPKKTNLSRDYASELVEAGEAYPAGTQELASRTAEIEQAMQAEELAYTVSGRIGAAMEPFIRPMGFDWRIGTALIGALAAKEVFVAQMGIVYSVGEADAGFDPLRARLRENYTRLQGFCIMLFCLISAPCVATFAIVRRESNSWKWPFAQFAGLTVLAFVVTTVVYKAGTLFGAGVG